MKRILLLGLIFALLLFCGCKKNKNNNSQAPNEVNEQNKEVGEASEEANSDVSNDTAEDTVTNKVVVREQYSKEGKFDISYSEDDSFEFSFSYHVPEIVDDSYDAKKINNEIYNYTKDAIETVDANLAGNAEQLYEPDYQNVKYEVYENGDIMSLLVVTESAYTDWIEYYAYNYDMAAHKLISNDDMLKTAGMTEDDFLAYARRTLGKAALDVIPDDEYLREQEEDEESYYSINRMLADVARYYAETVSRDNISKDMMMYFDDNNELCIVGFISVPAGAGRYYHNAKLDTTSKEADISRFMKLVKKYHYDGLEKDSLGLYDVEGFSGHVVHNVATGNQYEEEVYIGFDDRDESVFCVQFYGDGYGIAYAGSIELIGIDENGLLYKTILDNRDGKVFTDDEEPIVGSFYLMPYGRYDEELDDFKSGATYLYKDGTDILDSNGEEIDLSKSFG